MDKLMCMVVAFGAIATVMFQFAEAQTVHTVGDTTGWRVPTDDASLYTTWAAAKTFVVGDTLVFNFAPARHDVQEVQKASYDTCSSTNAIGEPSKASPANITLDSAGEHYYICTFTGHCQGGQKLAINVTGTSGGATPPTTGGSTTPTAIAAFSSIMVTSLSIALTFFY